MHIRHVTWGFVSGGWEVSRSAWRVCLLPCVCRARIWSRVSPWVVGVEGGGSWIAIVGDSFRCEEERKRGLDGRDWMSRLSAIRSCDFERYGIEGRVRLLHKGDRGHKGIIITGFPVNLQECSEMSQ
jgi:hypothetical protein